MGVRHRLLKLLGSRRTVLLAVLAGLAIRIVWAFVAGDAYRYYDSDSYVKISESLLSGKGFLWGDEATGQRMGRPPLYPLLVAATSATVAGHKFLLLYLAQSVLGALSILFFAGAARRLVGRVAGGISALFVAFDPFLVFFSGTVLSETLFVFFLSALFYFVVLILERSGFGAAVLAGLAAGAAFLTRPSVPGVVALFAFAILVWARPRWKGILDVIAMLLVSFLVVAPWAVRNHRLSGRWVFTTLGVGASLYDGIGPQADGSSNMDFLHGMPGLASMTEEARDDYLFWKAVDTTIESPGRVLRLAPVKAWRFWSPAPNSEDFRSPLYIVVSAAAVVPIYLLAVAAVFGGVLRRRDFFVLASAPVYFALVHMVFVGSIRYRCPVMPFAAIMGAAFFAALLARGKKGLAAAFARAGGGRTGGRKTLKMLSSHKRRGLWAAFRVILFVILLAGVACAGGYAYYVSWVANPANVKALAADKIGLLFPGKEVKVGLAGFGLLSGFDLRNVEIFESGAATPVAKLDYAHIDFSRRGLLRFALVPKNISASGLYLDLVRREDGRWNLAPPVTEGLAKGPSGLAAARKRAVARGFRATLYGAFVSVDDRFSGYRVSFQVNSLTAASDEANPAHWNTTLDFGGGPVGKWFVSGKADVVGGTLAAEFRGADVDLGEGLGTRLPQSARAAYDEFTPSGPAQVSGKISYSQGLGWDFDITASLDGCAVRPRNFPVTVSNLAGKLRFGRAGASLEEFRGNAFGGRVEFSGATEGYGSRPAFAVTLAATGVQATDELRAALSEGTRKVVESLNPRGVFDLAVRIGRDQGPGVPLKVALDAYPREVSASYANFPYQVDGLQGHIAYADGRVDIDNLAGRSGPCELLFNGSVINANHSPETALTIRARNLPLDEKLRCALPERAARAWANLALSGRCDLEANVAKATGGPLSLALDAELLDARVTSRDFPYPLYSGKGRVRFENDSMTFESLAFRHGESRICFQGTANVKSGVFDVEAVATDLAVEQELTRALPEKAADFVHRTRLSGLCDVTLALSRSPEGKLEFKKLKGDISQGSFTLPQLPLDFGAAGVTFALADNAVDITRFEGLVFSGASGALLPVLRFAMVSRPPSEIAAAGVIGVGARRDWKTRFETRGLFVDDWFSSRLPAGLRGYVQDAKVCGIADVSGTSSFDPEGPGNVDYNVSFDCADACIFAGWPVDGIQGEITVAGRSAGGDNTLRAAADLRSICVGGKEMTEASIVMAKEQTEMRIEHFQAKMLGGTLAGQGRAALTGRPGYGFYATVSGMDFSQIVEKMFAFRKEGLAGTLNASMKVLCLTGKDPDAIGSAEADVYDGTLWEVPMLLAMMNVINLKLPERTQFHSAHVRLAWTNEGVIIEKLSMASEPATIFGTGRVDYSGNIDMMFDSQPGRVPVLSVLARALGRSIVKAHITGTFDKPQVALVPAGPLGRLLDAIKRALTRGRK